MPRRPHNPWVFPGRVRGTCLRTLNASWLIVRKEPGLEELRTTHRLPAPIARRRRVAQHLLHRATVDPEPPTGLMMAQTLLDNCKLYRCAKLHAIHPPPPTKPTRGHHRRILRRRDPTNRALPVEHYSAAVNRCGGTV